MVRESLVLKWVFLIVIVGPFLGTTMIVELVSLCGYAIGDWLEQEMFVLVRSSPQ